MKKIIILLIVLQAHIGASQSVLISPNNGSKLIESNSTNKAIQMPSVATTSAIASPQKGMVVFDDALGNLSYFNGSIWISLSNSTTGWAVSGTDLSNTNSGNVGIGTISPLSSLHLFKTTNPAVLFQNSTTGTTINDGFYVGNVNTSSGKGFLWNNENASIGIGTNNTERLTVLGNGNVGIGTVAPTAKLAIDGDIVIKKTTKTTAGIENALNRGGGSSIYFNVAGTATLNGIAGGQDGMLLYLFTGAGSTLVINNENPNAIAANRIATNTGVAVTINGRGGATMIYDASTSFWRIIGIAN
jgi:hypothetical protein